MIESMLDGSGYLGGDYGLALLITMAAILTYCRIAFDASKLKLPIARLAMAFGFTVWAMRFWWTLLVGGDIIVAPISVIAIALVLGGYSYVQLYAIRRALLISRHPVWCIQDPEQPCAREDRLQDAMTLRDDK